MPQLFTVRWPVFARLEALLLFPVAVALAGEAAPIRTFITRVAVPVVAPLGARLGASNDVLYWAALSLAAVLPWFVLLLVADRFLTVRKGFTVLSLVAISIWAWSAHQYSDFLTPLLANYLPERLLDGFSWLPAGQIPVALAGGLAVLLHLKALWTGVRDEGDVASRLVDACHLPRRRPAGQSRQNQDLYYQQTAAFRDWQPSDQFGGHIGGPRENSMVKVLTAITWICVVAGMGAAWHNWNDTIGPDHGNSDPLVESAALASTKAYPVPAVQSAAAMSPGNVHTVAAPTVTAGPAVTAGAQPVVNMPMPAVQRPTEISTSIQTPHAIGGPNEAVAERAGDGSFAFDAVVNGSHVRMLFDTGASVVGLRAEDAVNLGIPLSRLTYSAKIKTANGTAEVAPVMIDTMIIGNISLRNVPGFVAKEGMLQENLLGQTFLARLSGFNVEKNVLVLRGR